MLRINSNKKLKKLIAFILLALTIFSTAQPILAVSDSGTGTWTPGQWDSGFYTTDNHFNVGVLIRRLVNNYTGERLTVFCAECGVDSSTGKPNTATHIKPTDPKMKEACKVAYLGWYKIQGNYVVDGGILDDSWAYEVRLSYVFTQQMIWEVLGQSNAIFTDSNIQNRYVEFKTDINNQINRMKTKPSFSDTTVTVQAGETTTLIDSNGVLADYSSIDTTTNEIRFTHNKGENTMNITVEENCNIEDLRITDEMMKNWGLIKDETKENNTTVYFQFQTGVQDQLYAMHYNDPVAMSLNLEISRLGNLELRKLNTNGDLVDGAKFRITGANGYNELVIVTNGKITLEKLTKGTYTIHEEESPSGYILNTETYQVEVKPNQTATQAIVNTEPTGSITVEKVNANGDKVQGAKFTIIAGEDIYNVARTVKYYSKEEVVATITTNNDGIANKSELPLGKYKVQESEVPTGYLLNKEQKEVVLKYKDQNTNVIYGSVTVENTEPTGSITVEKTNTNGDKVQGAKFTITADEDIYNVARTVKYYSKEEVVATITTNNDGIANKSELPLGKYKVKEIEVPTGYLLNKEQKEVVLKYKDQNTNVIYGSVTVENTEPTGSITVEKTNTNGDKVQGAKFTITADEDIYNVAKTVKHYSKGDVVATVTTNNEGIANKSSLPLGKYKVQESEVPTGYLLNSEQQEVILKYKDQNTNVIYGSVTIENEEPTGNLSIEKTDRETGNKNRVDQKSHHGDATIKGTVYTLYAKERITNVAGTIKYFEENEPIATFTFDEYGVASIKITNNSTPAKISIDGTKLTGLPMGRYYAKETIVPTGYTKDTKVYDFTFSYKDMNTKVIEVTGTATNTVEKAPFEVIKISTNKNAIAETVANAEFTAILSKYVEYYGDFDEAKKHLDEFATDEYSIFRTGTDGHGISGLLAYGEYIVRETYTPSSEIETVEQFYVTIDKDSKIPIKELVANDYPFEAYIKLQKQDKKTGKFVTYSNATFELYRLNEDTNKWEQVQCKVGDKYCKSWMTNAEGVAKTETKLEAGNYKLSEIKVPTGYTQLDEEITFKVDNRNSTLNYDKDWDAWITVTAKNEQPKGTLKLNKKVTLREDIDKTMIKEIDFTKISFELVADEKIIDYADGSTVYEKGEVVGKYNLKADGTLIITNLPMGHYYLKELETIEGVALDETEHKIAFEQKDTVTKEYVVEANIENKTTVIEISKTDITGEKELIGAKLIVKNENNEVVDSWVSNEKSHKIEGLKVGQTYTLTEEIVPDGYVKATTIKFTVKNTADIQKVVMIDKQVTVSKEDVGGKEVEGAELKVVDKDGKIVDSWTSTKEVHRIKGLTEGESYTLYENYASEGFVIANKIEFTVTEDKETQEIKMIDKVVEISKVNIVGEKLEGATLIVTNTKNKNVIVDKWVSTKEAHKVSGLIEGESYILHEEIAVDGYVKATDIEFTVTEDKETQKITMIDKQVTVSKEDIAGKEIEGAELKVVDKDGKIVDSWTSTKEVHKIKGLTEGESYTLYEDYASEGFVIANKIEFTVTEDKETQEIKMIDKIVEISKVNIAGEELEGATLVVTNTKTKNIVDKWVSTKEAHKVSGLIEGESYILHEEITVDGYVKATDIEFIVTEDKETQRIQMIDKVVEIVKTDLVTGEELEGAELEVIDKETGETIDKWTSNKEPHKVVGLEENKTYILKETTCPYGYKQAEEIEFTVTEDKETQRVEMKDMPILKDIRVVKVDSKTKEIIKDKFTFGLYEDSECTKLIKEIEANEEEGFVTFKDLRYGIFYIKELKSPKEYELSNRVAKVEINDKGVVVDGIEIQEENTVYSFEFENQKIETPKTGDTRNMLLAISIFVISLLGLVTLAVVKLKNKNR